jgi:hypothetical protein
VPPEPQVIAAVVATLYLQEEGEYACQHTLHVSLAHLPDRPLVSMQPGLLTKHGSHRHKLMDTKRLQSILRASAQHREGILQEMFASQRELKRDLHRMKRAFRVQLDILYKKPVTKRQLLTAATTIEAAKSSKDGDEEG